MATLNPAYDGLRVRLAGVMKDQPAGDPAAAAQALLKVIGAGLPRTGTSSLEAALDRPGFGPT
ncbi:sulfotransferase [Promicromonospora panici]|uniref:sulfotransferase n=1 Tax=Promicromonospora panici TaxID=2219658 RepID=UPI001A929A7D|nr:sulfotransferase [Promicromonospora panici]